MQFIGLDPGASGGIAIIDEGMAVLYVSATPATERDVLLALPKGSTGVVFAMLERVWSSPGWGHVGAFKFGLSYGGLRMALTARGIRFDEVLPVKWQTAMGCRSGGDKNITKRRAQALFPSVRVTHATADALLLAEHCRRSFYLASGQRTHGQEGKGQTVKEARREDRAKEDRAGKGRAKEERRQGQISRAVDAQARRA